MKRLQSACLEQTIRFDPEDEYYSYKARLDAKHVKYQIIDVYTQADGSILAKIKRQYNGYDCGDYIK